MENADMDVSLGIIGMGFMGRTHLEAFSRIPGCRVAAVADRSPERLRDALDHDTGNLKIGDDRTGPDLEGVVRHDGAEDLIADPGLDLVVVTTPTPTHAELATKAVRAGRYVLVEKPDPISRSRSRRGGAGRGVRSGPPCAILPAWWMRDAVRSAVRRCVEASFLRCGRNPVEPRLLLDVAKSGDAIVDLHIHVTDFVLPLRSAVRRPPSGRRYLRTAYEFERGPKVVAEGMARRRRRAVRMEADLVFEAGSLRFELGRDPEVVFTSSDGDRVPLPGRASTAPATTDRRTR